jgi:hypothetical protein
MAQFKFKNLPKGFVFPITKHEIREFIRTSNAHFELIEFAGLSFSEQYFSRSSTLQSHSVCYLEAEYKESLWHFNLQVSGVRLERYEERRPEVAQALLSQIEKWVQSKLALSETAPKKPCRAIISFDLREKPEGMSKLSEWT